MIEVPKPIIDDLELAKSDEIAEEYQKMLEPSTAAKMIGKAKDKVPDQVKVFAKEISKALGDNEILIAAYEKAIKNSFELYRKANTFLAKNLISREMYLNQIQKKYPNVYSMDQICLMRATDIYAYVNKNVATIDFPAIIIQAGITGAVGIAGLPFNIAISTLLYFRVVQSIAISYGYDVKENSDEMIIASRVLANAFDPTKSSSDEIGESISKVLVLANATTVKQSLKHTWAEMANMGGVPLLLTQIRALGNSTAKKALQKAGKKGLEAGVFTDLLTIIGKNLTKETATKSIYGLSIIFSIGFDSAQMSRIVKYANCFYYQRFVSEKNSRINALVNNRSINDEMGIVDVDFEDVSIDDEQLAIISKVADMIGVDLNKVLSEDKSIDVAKARRYSAYIIKKKYNLTNEEIGNILGNRKASTISSYLSSVRKEIENNKTLEGKLSKLIK